MNKKLSLYLSFSYYSFILIIFSGATSSNKKISPLSKKEIEFVKKYTLPNGLTFEKAKKFFSDKALISAFERRDLEFLKNRGFKLYNTWGNIVVEHPKLDGWIIKTGSRFGNNCNNILRITKAEKIRDCVATNKYQNIMVPKHYLFHIPGKNLTLKNKNYLIFCEKVDISKKNLGYLTDRQVLEICRVIRQCGMCDTGGDNIRILNNGQIAFIDTEPFLELNRWWWSYLETFGLRVFKGSIGSHIFRRQVSKDRRLNRRLYAQNKNQRTVPNV